MLAPDQPSDAQDASLADYVEPDHAALLHDYVNAGHAIAAPHHSRLAMRTSGVSQFARMET